MPWPRRTLLVALALASAGCPAPLADSEGRTLAAGDDVTALRSCIPDAPRGELGRALQLELFLGPGVPEPEVRRHLEAARQLWAAHGLTLTSSSEVHAVEHAHLLAGTREELTVALQAEGIAVHARPTREEAARAGRRAVELASAPLRRFLEEQARPPRRGRVNVVVLPRIAAEGSLAATSLRSFEGIALAPQLAGTLPAGAPEGELLRALGEAPFTPTIVLSWRELRPRGQRGQALAHEIGHVLGLPHARGLGNLMNESRRTDCAPVLTEQQISAVTQSISSL